MKKFLTIVLALMLGLGLASAQNFTVTCNGQEVTEGCTVEIGGVVDMVNLFQLTGYFTVTNTSSAPLSFNMSYEALTEVPEGGFVTICGFGNCISASTFPEDHTIESGATAGEDHEMDALDVAYMPPFGDETPVTVKMTMMDKTAGKDLTFTIKFTPEKQSANESAVKAVVSAYPNPAADAVNFRMDNVKAGSVIVLRDLNGRTVRTAKVAAGTEVSMSLAGLASGMYFYTVEEKGRKTASGKLLVR